MTNNQLLMSILRNSGKNHRANNVNLILGLVAITGVISVIVVVLKNEKLNKDANFLRKAYYGTLGKLHKIEQEHEALLFSHNEILKKFDVIQKENIVLKNEKIRQSNS